MRTHDHRRPDALPRHALCLSVILLLVPAALRADEPAKEPAAFYDPVVRQIEGWTVKLDPQLLEKEHADVCQRALTALANHLQRVKYIVAAAPLERLQQVPIWVDLHHELRNMQYHPGRGWLVEHGYDPRLVKHVHIPRAEQLYARHMWAKHPYVVLHELAHGYHDQVLGFDDPDVLKVYEAAKEKGIYEDVLLYTGKRVRHYGMTNHKEFFAETTESYLGVNDFYPFVRAELKEHDPAAYHLMEAIWGEVR